MYSIFLFLLMFNAYSADLFGTIWDEETTPLPKKQKLTETPSVNEEGAKVYFQKSTVLSQTISSVTTGLSAFTEKKEPATDQTALKEAVKQPMLIKSEETADSNPRIHLSESAERALCLAALRPISQDFDDSMCVCTTLKASAGLVSTLKEYRLHAHVGLAAGCVEGKDPRFINDFSKVLEENKTKTTFVFVQTVGDSLFSAGEFLVQLAQSNALNDSTKFILCLGIEPTEHHYSIGSVQYSAGDREDHTSTQCRLVIRAAQVEQMSKGNPCDSNFMESDKYLQLYREWRAFVLKHLLYVSFGDVVDTPVFSTQATKNLLIHKPDVSNPTIMQHLDKGTLDVLIGSPKSGPQTKAQPLLPTASCPPQKQTLSPRKKDIIFGCGVRAFKILYNYSDKVRYICAPSSDLSYSGDDKDKPLLTQGRCLLCAGPPTQEVNVLAWAKRFCQKTKAQYSQVIFVPCKSQPSKKVASTHFSGRNFTPCRDIPFVDDEAYLLEFFDTP